MYIQKFKIDGLNHFHTVCELNKQVSFLYCTNKSSLLLHEIELSFCNYETVICLFILNCIVPQSIIASQSQIISNQFF